MTYPCITQSTGFRQLWTEMLLRFSPTPLLYLHQFHILLRQWLNQFKVTTDIAKENLLQRLVSTSHLFLPSLSGSLFKAQCNLHFFGETIFNLLILYSSFKILIINLYYYWINIYLPLEAENAMRKYNLFLLKVSFTMGNYDICHTVVA